MNYDSITGLPLKESFLSFVNQFIKREENERFAFLAVHLHPGYEAYNLSFGPQRNFLLSGIVQKFIRRQEYILSAYRHEADTFVAFIDTSVLLQGSLEEALLNAFQSYTEYVQQLFPACELSLQGGICMFHDIEQPAVCINHALEALQMLSSQHGKHDIMFYEQAMEHFQSIEHQVLPLFENAWSNNHIFIHLQPKVDLYTREVLGAEALVRVTDTNGKVLKPASFLPVLEKYNLTYELDLMVAERILILLQNWIKAGVTPFPISINLSETALHSVAFRKVFCELIDKYQTAFGYLVIELRSNIFTTKDKSLIHIIQELHRLGCHILMDDVNEKPDLRFINLSLIDGVICNRNTLLNAIRDPESSSHLAELIKLYEDCNISVICKGIESKEEEKYAKLFNISLVQGFYYGRPIPFDIFQKKYLNHIFVHET